MSDASDLRSLGSEDIEQLQRLLSTFIDEAGARCALMLDRSGRLLASVGDAPDFDETTFASLAAADFAASDQLAGLLGEDEFTSLYHQGEAGSMYLADVSGYAIMAAVFDHSTTLGMVRLRTRRVVPEVVELLNELVGRPSTPGQGLDAGWLSAAADEIDRLFTG